MTPPAAVQTNMLRPTVRITSRPMPLEKYARTPSSTATVTPSAQATGISRRSTRHMSAQHSSTSPTAMARMTSVAD